MIAHVDGNGNIDPSSAVQINPDVIDFSVPDVVWQGLLRRWDSITVGQCACGGELMLTNRQQRRAWRRVGLEGYDALVFHQGDCSAVTEKTRLWVYRNRRLAA